MLFKVAYLQYYKVLMRRALEGWRKAKIYAQICR